MVEVTAGDEHSSLLRKGILKSLKALISGILIVVLPFI